MLRITLSLALSCILGVGLGLAQGTAEAGTKAYTFTNNTGAARNEAPDVSTQSPWTAKLGLSFAVNGSATVMATDVPPELKALIAARQQEAQQPAASQPLPAASQSMQVGGALAPLPATMAYRRQGSNSNGVLLLAKIPRNIRRGTLMTSPVGTSATLPGATVTVATDVRSKPADSSVW